MKKIRIWLCLLSVLAAFEAQAFSSEMISAVEQCLAFAENLPDTGGTPIELRVIGQEDGACVVSLGSPNEEANQMECRLNEEQTARLSSVMAQMSVTNNTEDWEPLWEEFAAQSCYVKGIEKTQAEQTDEALAENNEQLSESNAEEKNVLVFSIEFMNALRDCKPAVSEETEEGIAQLKIIGLKKGKCQMQYDAYDLSVPLSILPNIHNTKDVQVLLRNREIAHYTFKPDYVYDGLLYALDACRRKRDYTGSEVSGQQGDAVWKSGLTAEYFEQACTVYLNNRVELEDDVIDQTVQCHISEAELETILSYYQEILDLYGAKKRQVIGGKIQTTSAQENEKTHQSDTELMYYLQQNGYCRKPK